MNQVVLFVCTGNSCRSPMAAGLLKKILGNQKDIRVLSAGIVAFPNTGASEYAIEVMQRVGVDISHHQAQRISREIIDEATLVLTMTKMHRVEVLEMSPQAKGKVYLLKEFDQRVGEAFLDIPDPIGQPIEDYELCLEKIKNPIEYIAKKILKVDKNKKEDDK